MHELANKLVFPQFVHAKHMFFHEFVHDLLLESENSMSTLKLLINLIIPLIIPSIPQII